MKFQTRNHIPHFLLICPCRLLLCLSGLWGLLTIYLLKIMAVGADGFWFISPVQGVWLVLPAFLFFDFEALKNTTATAEILYEIRLNGGKYVVKTVLFSWLPSVFFIGSLYAFMLAGMYLSGQIIVVKMAALSFFAKLLLLSILSMMVRILNIFGIQYIFGYAVIYLYCVVDYVFTYSLKLYQIPVFFLKYAFSLFDKPLSWIILFFLWLGILILMVIMDLRLKDFLLGD